MTRTNTKNSPALSAAAQSRQVLDTAEDEHARMIAHEDQTTSALDDLAARVDRGDQTVTGIEWATAHAEQEISTGLVAWAAQQVADARTHLINDDTRLADLFSPLVSELFDGKVQVSTTGNPADVSPTDDGTPVLWIVQPEVTVVSGGSLSGPLKMIYLRPSLFAALDDERLEQLTRRAGYAIRMTNGVSSQRQGDLRRDELLVSVLAAAPTVPILDQAPTSEDAREVGREVTQAVHPFVRGPQLSGPGDDSQRGSTALIKWNLTHKTNAAGDAGLATVDTIHHVTPGSLLATETERIHRTIREIAVPDLVGRLVPGAGRVSTAEVTKIDLPSDDPAAPRRPWVITSRLTLTFQL